MHTHTFVPKFHKQLLLLFKANSISVIPTILWNPRTGCRPLKIDHQFSGWASETNALMFWPLFYSPTLPSAGNASSSPTNNNHSDWMIPKGPRRFKIISYQLFGACLWSLDLSLVLYPHLPEMLELLVRMIPLVNPRYAMVTLKFLLCSLCASWQRGTANNV